MKLSWKKQNYCHYSPSNWLRQAFILCSKQIRNSKVCILGILAKLRSITKETQELMKNIRKTHVQTVKFNIQDQKRRTLSNMAAFPSWSVDYSSCLSYHLITMWSYLHTFIFHMGGFMINRAEWTRKVDFFLVSYYDNYFFGDACLIFYEISNPPLEFLHQFHVDLFDFSHLIILLCSP